MQYTPKVGQVWIRDFDKGVVEQLQPTIEGNAYVVTFNSGLSPNTNPKVKVIFDKPEQVMDYFTQLPLIHVKREAFTPNLERWHSYGLKDYQAGVLGTELPSGGFGEVEEKLAAWPYDMNYQIIVYSRYEYEAQHILRWILKRFQPRQYIRVVDSLNVERHYTFFNDNAISDFSEIVDAANRIKAYGVSILVEGELDMSDPMLYKVVQDVEISMETF